MTDIGDVSVVCDIRFELGEGPSFDPASGILWWFDIVNRKLAEMKPGTGTVTIHSLPFMASAIARIDARRQLLVAEDGLYIRDATSGSLSLHVSLEEDNHATRSNDARVHPSGAFWIGTMGKMAEKHAGSIYWHYRGELRKLYSDITIPNSICFSPDGGIAYFADSAGGKLMKVGCDPATGLPTGEPELFFDNRGVEGGLDGSVCDGDGVVWNARWGGAALDAYSPDGALLRTVDLPVRQPSCPAFYGHDANRIALTSAWQNMSASEREADPLGGCLLDAGITVKGRFEPDAAV
ncbi:MAG: SMP-30/gluconolactonase/LRE family protein [Nitratireductor sp.]